MPSTNPEIIAMMEHRSQVQPVIHEPTRRDPRILQTEADSHLPQRLPTRVTANESKQNPPINDGQRSSQGLGYHVNGRRVSISSPLPGKELLRQYGEEATTWQRQWSGRGQQQLPFGEAPSPDGLPAAPDVPRARPPVSYQRPYVDTVAPAARYGSSRSFSARARSLQQEAYLPTLGGPADQSASSGEQERARPYQRTVSDSSTLSYVQVRPTISASSSGNPALPIEHSGGLSLGPNGTVASPLSRSNTRKESTSTTGSKNWASDRSPLQKLEVKLNDISKISKEEKRARVQEAEQRLRDSKAARGNRESGQEAASPSEQLPPRRVSRGMSKDPEKLMLDEVDSTAEGSLRRDIDTENETKVTTMDRAPMQVGDIFDYRQRQSHIFPKSYNEGGTDRFNDTGDRLELQHGQSLHSPLTANPSDAHYRNTERTVQFQDRQHPTYSSEQGHWPEGRATVQERTHPDATAPTSSGAVSGHGVPVMIGRNGSRRLQKEQPLVRESKQSYSVPSQAIQNPRQQIVGYAQPPPVGTQRPRQGTEFIDGGYERIERLSNEKHHLSDVLHHGKRSPSMPLETHRVAPRRWEEWRRGMTARLTALDFLMEPQDPSLKQPWWERKARGQKRVNQGQQSSDKGGSFEDENGMRSLIFFLQ